MIRSTMPPDYREQIDLTEDTASMIKQAVRNDISILKDVWKKIKVSRMNDNMKESIKEDFDGIDMTIAREAPITDGKPKAKRQNSREAESNDGGGSMMMMTDTGSENNPIVLDDDVNMKDGDTKKEFSKLKIRF